MPRSTAKAAARRATNATLPEALLQDACERGPAVADARRRRWLEANQCAMDAWNDHVAAHGLPLAAFRRF